MKLVIISGRSGSGKTICLNVLEDMGYYCVNNLPMGLLVHLPSELKTNHDQVAVSIDARNLQGEATEYNDIIKGLDEQNIEHETIFLDADDTKLLERFSETRRKHPLSNKNLSLKEALNKENSILLPIKEHADLVFDTTDLTIYQLRDLLRERVAKRKQTLSLLFQSFGFKRGLPRDSDFEFDVRILPNPYWEPSLRKYTGKDKPVAEWLSAQAPVKEMMADITHFLEKWLPELKKQDRNYLTVSIGCTGGQHRSVYIAEQLATHFAEQGEHVQLRHGELT
tara:strand:+ start:35013 stop:35855 length:843 start_codon:yes stop_codon:yes gene_type:complete